MRETSGAPIEWPGLDGGLKYESRLVWVPVGPIMEPPEWVSKLPFEEISKHALEESPAEGELLGDFSPGREYLKVLFWGTEEAWWVSDAGSGKVLAGRIPCLKSPAGWQLAFVCFLAVFITFLGGGLAQSIIAHIVQIAGLMNPVRGAGPVGLLLGSPIIAWLIWRLWRLLPEALEEPVLVLQSGYLELPAQNRWLGLVKALGILSGLAAILGLPSALAAAVMVGSLPVLILTCIQTGVLALLAWKCLKLSEGHQLSSGKVTWQGTIGEKVGLGIRIALFALAAQLLAGTVALSGIASNTLQGSVSLLPWLVSNSTRFGALLAVVTARLSGSTKSVLVAGTGANLVGAFWLGPWFKALLTLVAVSLPGLIKALRSAPANRGVEFQQAFRDTWSFNLGGVLGRLVGRVFGLFFLGLGGSAVGQALGEQIVSCIVLLSQHPEGEPAAATHHPG